MSEQRRNGTPENRRPEDDAGDDEATASDADVQRSSRPATPPGESADDEPAQVTGPVPPRVPDDDAETGSGSEAIDGQPTAAPRPEPKSATDQEASDLGTSAELPDDHATLIAGPPPEPPVDQAAGTPAPPGQPIADGERASSESTRPPGDPVSQPPPQPHPFSQPSPPWNRKSIDERKEALARAVASQLALGNRRVETQSDHNAVIVFGQPVNHVLHAIITIFSCGLWGVVWIVLALSGGEKREMIVVDEYGNTTIQQLT